MKQALLKALMLMAILPLAASLHAQDKAAGDAVVVQNILMDAVSKLETSPAEALSELEYLDRRMPADDAVKYYLGILAFSSGHGKEAEKYLKEACELDSTNFWYKDALASLYSAIGRNEQAAAIYLDLLERNPSRYGNAYTLTLKGDRFLSSHDDTLALDCYERALAYDPEYAPAVLGRAEVNRLRGNVPGFLADMHAFTLNPDIKPSAKCDYVSQILKNINYGFYRSWGAQLDSLVQGCVRTHPADSSALRLAGSWYYSTSRKEEGRIYFNRLTEAYPRDIKMRYLRLGLLLEDGNMKDVLDECENIIRLGGEKNPEVLPAMSTAGDCWHAMGNDRKAMKYYDKVLRVQPDNALTLNNYAYYLSLSGKKLSKAEKMSRTALDKDPENPSYLDTYGWILHLLGRDAEAKPYFKKAMVYGGKDHLEILEHYSVVLKALGEDALSNYYRSLAETKKSEK